MLPLRRALLAELAGTYLLVLIGTGSVASAVLTGAQAGLWQVAVVWGFGVTLAIYVSATASGAHLNPAVSLAFALLRPCGFPMTRLLPYAAAQLAGAVLAGATVAAVFWPFLERFEAVRGIVRGAPGSELSAMVFGEYFPNPALFGTEPAARALVSPLHAVAVEAFGTAVLTFVIFSLTAPRNAAAPRAGLAPFFIGFTVAVLISVFAPITQAGWNPARDFGPRLVAYLLGWGPIAIPGPESGFWVYIAGPLVGGPLGGLAACALGMEQGPAARALGMEQGPAAEALSASPGAPAQTRVLFICTHNSARSQMAEAWLRWFAGDRFVACSAGTVATGIRPMAVRVMREAGIDLSGYRSKTLDAFVRQPWDYVITVCDDARESCPVFPGASHQVHWSFPDPSTATGTEEEQLGVYRAARDAIRDRVREFVQENAAGTSR